MFVKVAIIAAFVTGLALAMPFFSGFLYRTAPAAPDVSQEAGSPAATAPAKVARTRARPIRTSGDRTVIEARRSGHFITQARVGGRSFDVMVDTGATSVALTYETARRLGVRPRKNSYRVAISTANGVIHAAPVTLSRLRLGRLSVRDVEAMVLPAGALDINLLGMSFLGRLSHFEISGDRLVLIQ